MHHQRRPVSQSNRNHPQEGFMEALSVGVLVRGRLVQTVEQSHVFNGFIGGGGVSFASSLSFFPQQTVQGNIFL